MKEQVKRGQSSIQNEQQSTTASTANFDKRSSTIQQKKLQDIANTSPQATQLQAASQQANNTGLPDNLKGGIESLSGVSLDNVKVNYNSDKPAQLNAHAYAQGSEIHVASGQEQHLPHEAWHVVQQAQGRVKPTTSVNGANVNDDASLESEADVMGAKALNIGANNASASGATANNGAVQRATKDKDKAAVAAVAARAAATGDDLGLAMEDLGAQGLDLGHELAHVAEQGAQDPSAVEELREAIQDDPALENEADMIGALAAQVPTRARGGAVQLATKDKDKAAVAAVAARAAAQGDDLGLAMEDLGAQGLDLGHEMAHVAQQGAQDPSAVEELREAIQDDPALENEADMIGALAAQVPTRARGGAVQREEKEDNGVNQKTLVNKLSNFDISEAKDYRSKRALLIEKSIQWMKDGGADQAKIDELINAPLVDHSIDMITRGSKTKKIAEGIEVQIINGKKYDQFLNEIGAKTGGEVHAAPLKNYQRMEAKENDKYDGDISRIKDVIRASFIFDNVDQIAAAQETIAGMGSHKVIELKDRFNVDDKQLEENLNYKDVIFIVETENVTGYPVKIELQLHLRKLHEAKTKIKASFPNGAHHAHVLSVASKLGLNKSKIKDNQYTGHDFYKVIRELTKSPDDFEQQIVAAAKEQSRKIYGGAWEDYKNEEK